MRRRPGCCRAACGNRLWPSRRRSGRWRRSSASGRGSRWWCCYRRGERSLGAAVTPEDLETLCDLATDYSRYAAEETPAGGVSLRAGRLPGGAVRHGGDEGRGEHRPAGPVLRRCPHRPGAEGDRGGGGAPAVSGRAVSEHPAAVAPRRRQDHAAAGSGAVPLLRRHRQAGSAGLPYR